MSRVATGENPQAPPGHAPRVALSTSSVYPSDCETAFRLASELGYDGIEVMVLADPVSQSASALRALSERYRLPVVSVHAPTLLVTQRVYGTSDPWTKVDRSIDLAQELGSDLVVVHPPFRWQRDYAEGFADGVAVREVDREIRLAVENMFPWRARHREVQAYLPDWDPVPQPFDNVTLDLSHTATAGSDVLAMQQALGDRLVHVHLADGSGSVRDEHLVPGRGGQPCGPFLERLVDAGYRGDVVLEVSTRRLTPGDRILDLAEALAFARLYLTVPVP